MANNQGFKEGPVAKTIEQVTARVPSDAYLWTAVGAMAISLGLKIAGRKHAALFVGQWAPTILIMGLYNKLVKVEGSEGDED